MINNWEAVYPNLTRIHTVIFEYDAWPTGKKEAEWQSDITWEYRSADSYYMLNKFDRVGLHNLNENNNCIEWEGEYK